MSVMTGQEIVDSVKRDIGQPTSTGFFTDQDILDIVNEGYIDFCRFTEILEAQTTQQVTAYQSLYSVPADFIESRQFRWSYNRQLFPYSERKLDYNQKGWQLEFQSYSDNLTYYNWGTFRLRPIPTVAGTITHRYSRFPTTNISLTTSPEFISIYHDALVTFSVAECFYVLRNYMAADEAWADYLRIRQDAKSQVRQYTRSPDTMLSQRHVTVFNYPYYDQRFRSRGGN
jgi:hypothetical protein